MKTIKTIHHLITNLNNNNFLNNKKIGIAVSGGIDSLVLLDIFSLLKKDKNIKIYAIHFNHRWRKESDLDANLVENYCKRKEIPYLYGEIKGYVKKTEEEGRNKRYIFFKSCIKKYKIDILCTAHHKDDLVETIIFRMLRGTGPEGVFAIREIRDINLGAEVYRPLINLSKEEIICYARKNKLIFAKDKSNENLIYKRNLIRKKILPLLGKINSGFEDNITSFAKIVYCYNSVVDFHFSNILLKAISLKSRFIWDRGKFRDLNIETQLAFLYWFLNQNRIQGSVKNLNLISDIIQDLGEMDLNKEYKLIVSKDKISFLKKKNIKSNIHKNIEVKKIDFYLDSSKKDLKLKKDSYLLVNKFLKGSKWHFPKDSENRAFVDLKGYTNKKLTIRFRENGDYIVPLGMNNKVKLKKYLINKKIPVSKRDKIPLICYKKEVLWLPGFVINEKIKVKMLPTHEIKLI